MKLEKSSKLRKRGDFLSFKARSRRFFGSFLIVDYKASSLEEIRFGISASRRFGNAVQRNRFKRQVRELFRLNRHLLPSQLDLNVKPRSSALGASFHEMKKDFESLGIQCSQTIRLPRV